MARGLGHRGAQAAQFVLLVLVLTSPAVALLGLDGEELAEAAAEDGAAGCREHVDARRPRVGTRPGERERATPARVEVEQPGRHAVEELPIVAGEQHRTAPGAQPVLEEGRGVVVEVVRRLVEQQRVGGAEQQRGEREPGALSARDLVDPAVEPEPGDAEPVEHLVAARVGRPDVGAFGRVEGRRVPCGGCRGGALVGRVDRELRRGHVELALDGANLGEGRLEHLADAIVGTEGQLLREEPGSRGTGEPTRHGRVAEGGGCGIRPAVGAGEQPEQRRLADAVLADQAEPLARRDGEAEVGEDASMRVRDREPVGAQVEGVGEVYSHARRPFAWAPGSSPDAAVAGGHERCTERRARGTMARATTRERSGGSRRASAVAKGARDTVAISGRCTPVSTAPQARDDGMCSLHSGVRR